MAVEVETTTGTVPPLEVPDVDVEPGAGVPAGVVGVGATTTDA